MARAWLIKSTEALLKRSPANSRVFLAQHRAKTSECANVSGDPLASMQSELDSRPAANSDVNVFLA